MVKRYQYDGEHQGDGNQREDWNLAADSEQQVNTGQCHGPDGESDAKERTGD